MSINARKYDILMLTAQDRVEKLMAKFFMRWQGDRVNYGNQETEDIYGEEGGELVLDSEAAVRERGPIGGPGENEPEDQVAETGYGDQFVGGAGS